MISEQPAADLAQWWQRQIMTAHDDYAQAIHTAYQQLENAGLVSKVTVHRYLCGRCGKPLATVIRLENETWNKTLARTTDYKFSPGLNRERSVESARSRRTLDGSRHWPGHTYDVDELADMGESDVGFGVNCRHVTTTVLAADVLRITRNVKPGHPGKPTRLV
jgi:hypothetical protein